MMTETPVPRGVMVRLEQGALASAVIGVRPA
jgi:hypothetical protein